MVFVRTPKSPGRSRGKQHPASTALVIPHPRTPGSRFAPGAREAVVEAGKLRRVPGIGVEAEVPILFAGKGLDDIVPEAVGPAVEGDPLATVGADEAQHLLALPPLLQRLVAAAHGRTV